MIAQMMASEYRALVSAGNLPRAGVRGKSWVKRRNPEQDLQLACAEWVAFQIGAHPVLKWLFHTPNGGGRSKAEAGMFKAMGVKPGVPDFILPFPCGLWNGLAIELKTKSPSSRLSDDQRKWLKECERHQWVVGVARDIDSFIILVQIYLGNQSVARADRPRFVEIFN